MPALKPKRPAPPRWPLHLAAAAGASAQDFWVLGYSAAYDDRHGPSNPETYQSPTSRFTHVLHFRGVARDVVHRVPDRLLDVVTVSGGALAAGFPRGVFEVTAAGIVEQPFKQHAGVFTALWARADTVLAVGIHPFLLARVQGVWRALALPEGTTSVLEDIFGFSEQDVYIVGWEGALLHFDGRKAVALPSPTSRHLYAVAPLGDQHVCVAGDYGTLLLGNRHGWRHVPTHTDATIYALAALGGRVLYGTPDGLWAFDGKTAPVCLLDMPVQWVSSVGDAVVVSHDDAAWLYDGAALSRLDTVV